MSTEKITETTEEEAEVTTLMVVEPIKVEKDEVTVVEGVMTTNPPANSSLFRIHAP